MGVLQSSWHSHSACGAGFVLALHWWRQSHLLCPALPCSQRGFSSVSSLACLASLSWAEPVPLGSGTLAKGLWSGGCVGSVMYTAPCSPLFPHQGRRMGLPQAWESSCSWLLPCSVITLVLQPEPTAFQKCLQQIDTRAAGSLLQRNQNVRWNWVHLLRCFIHPGAVDQAGLNYTLPFPGVC